MLMTTNKQKSQTFYGRVYGVVALLLFNGGNGKLQITFIGCITPSTFYKCHTHLMH